MNPADEYLLARSRIIRAMFPEQVDDRSVHATARCMNENRWTAMTGSQIRVAYKAIRWALAQKEDLDGEAVRRDG